VKAKKMRRFSTGFSWGSTDKKMIFSFPFFSIPSFFLCFFVFFFFSVLFFEGEKNGRRWKERVNFGVRLKKKDLGRVFVHGQVFAA